jgi:starch-binding outer membrane protein, SusD/RagB family
MKQKTLKIKYKQFNSSYRIMSIITILLVMIQTSCKKMVEISPPSTSIAENAVYTNSITAISVLTGIYGNMINATGIFTGNRSISLLTSLSADELSTKQPITTLEGQYYTNSLSALVPPNAGSEQWSPLYNFVFKANAAIQGLTDEKANVLPAVVRNQLLGEAKYLRAFFYFYLANLYGDVPLALTTDPKINTNLSRTPKTVVYQQIISDLEDAQRLLSSSYLDQTLQSNTPERIRPTTWAASALLARVYLYTGDWSKSEEQATTVINNSSLFSLVPSLNNVFLKNSKEAIWQLQPTNASFNTQDAITFIIPASGPNASKPVYLSNNLLKSFEANDQRIVYGNWIDTVIYEVSAGIYDTVAYPVKYKINTPNNNITPATGSANMTEYLMVFRLAEQFLIRAEARAQQNNISGAKTDLNAIRTRAGLPNATAGEKSSLLAAILNERQTELFTEWGNRWFDLKRTGSVDAVMSVVTPQKSNGASWQSYQQVYPIPLSDLSLMPNIVQNSGY